MSNTTKRQSTPSAKRIIEYWKSQPQLPCDVKIDWDTAHEKCWCCGYSDPEFPEYTTERAHIIPHALGGSSDPENFVLLCPECHHDSPDVNDSIAMWDWIKLEYKNWLNELTLELRTIYSHFLIYRPDLNNNTDLIKDAIFEFFKTDDMQKQFSTHGFKHMSKGTLLWLIRRTKNTLKTQVPN